MVGNILIIFCRSISQVYTLKNAWHLRFILDSAGLYYCSGEDIYIYDRPAFLFAQVIIACLFHGRRQQQQQLPNILPSKKKELCWVCSFFTKKMAIYKYILYVPHKHSWRGFVCSLSSYLQ